jgi:hypothetical protein
MLEIGQYLAGRSGEYYPGGKMLDSAHKNRTRPAVGGDRCAEQSGACGNKRKNPSGHVFLLKQNSTVSKDARHGKRPVHHDCGKPRRQHLTATPAKRDDIAGYVAG